MKRIVRAVAVVAVVALGAGTARADSLPVIRGVVSGVELCAQSMCGAAIFVGFFRGRVGFNPFAVGTVGVAVHHGVLPVETGDCTPVTDGVWTIHASLRTFKGVTAGQLCYNGDNTYTVSVGMLVTEGGVGTMNAVVQLDHNVFPPTIRGDITQ